MSDLRGPDPRILVIDARILTPDRDGGSLRLFGVLRILRKLGYRVAFAASFPESFPPFCETLAEDAARLESTGVELPCHAARIPVDAHVRHDGSRYDVVWISGAYVASRHVREIRALAPQAALAFDTIDLHFLREFREARLTGNVNRVKNALKVKRAELAIARAADVTVIVSEKERATLAAEDPAIRTWVVPTIHEVHPSPPPLASRGDLVFLGSFTFSPNIDAMRFFSGSVFPDVLRRLPGVRLHILGSDPPDEIRSLASSSVLVTGYVPNLRSRFDACRLSVVPLRYGAGIKSKLLLSMGLGVPAVASPIAVEGLPVEDGRDILVAPGPAEWPALIERAYTDEALWNRLSANGRSLVARHYSAEVVEESVGRLFELLTIEASRRRAKSDA
jgi:O-antigen biosynthesis protein